MKNKIKIIIASILALLGIGSVATFGFENDTISSGSTPVTVSEIAVTSIVPAGSNLLVNGSFDNTPFDEGWTTSTPGDDATLEATEVASSTQALLCTMTADDADGCVLTQTLSTTNSSIPFNAYFDARKGAESSASTTIRLVITDAVQVYNVELDIYEGFTKCTYPDGLGSWTVKNVTSTADESFSDCEIDIIDLSTSEYQTSESGPSVGYPVTFVSDQVSFRFELFGNTGDEVYLDNVVINERSYTAYSDKTNAILTNPGNINARRSYSKTCIEYFPNTTDCIQWYTYDYDANELSFYTMASSVIYYVTSSEF